ncbi:hypothetical protein JCM10213_001445 [Rhodosporidiobolus nylandii]
MSDTDPSGTLAQLSTSLGALETALEPLLSKPFDELLEQSEDEPLVQARMQVLASYVVHDLIWVYLKAAGVEPSTHPVMEEIERLKGYFGKLKQAEGDALPAAEASKPRMQIDKSAANRFISAAINSGKASVDPSYTEADAEAGPSGTHIRFEDAEVDRLLGDKDEASDEEDVAMEIEPEKAEHVEEIEAEGVKGKGKETPVKGGKKEKKRTALDPFAGYDQPKPSTPASSSRKSKSAKSTPAPSTSDSPAATPQTSSVKRKRVQQATADTGTPSAAGTPSGEKKERKKKLKIKGAK